MVEVWRARTAPVPRGESCACPMPPSFMLGLPPSDRTLMSTRYKPLQGSTTVVGGGLASALVESALRVRQLFHYDTISKIRARHDIRGMSRATTSLLSRTACDEARDRQVFPHLPPRSSACTLYDDVCVQYTLETCGPCGSRGSLSSRSRTGPPPTHRPQSVRVAYRIYSPWHPLRGVAFGEGSARRRRG